MRAAWRKDRSSLGGCLAPAVERALIEEGVKPAEALRVVDDVMRGRLAEMPIESTARPLGWLSATLGLIAAAAGIGWVYYGFVTHPDTWGGASRGMWVGGGLAIGGLNVVRAELMRLMGR